jgi:hypothetical protein
MTTQRKPPAAFLSNRHATRSPVSQPRRRDYKKEDIVAVEISTSFGNDGSLLLTDSGRLAVCVIVAGVLSAEVIYWRLPRIIRCQAFWLPCSLRTVRWAGMCSSAGAVQTSGIRHGR